MSKDRYADVMSASKSVLSLLLGEALGSGRIESLGRKMTDYFPESFPASTDARQAETIPRGIIRWSWLDSAAPGPHAPAACDYSLPQAARRHSQ